MKSRPRIAALAGWALLTLLVTAGTLAAAEVPVPPSPQGRVNDYAGVLSAAERAGLEAQLIRYERGEGTAAGQGEPAKAGAPQIVLVVLPTLNGDPVEDVGLRFAERWKIGSKADDGVIVLVAVAERKIRIEVGYGAEGRLTDALSARIIREMIGPRLHRGEYAAGLRTGSAAIHQALAGLPVTGADAAAGAEPLPDRGGSRRGTGWGLGSGMIFLLFLLFALGSRGRGGSFLGGMLLGSMLGGRRGGDGGGSFGGGDGGGFSGGGGNFGGGGASGDF